MTVHITRKVAGEPTKIELTDKEIYEAKMFCADMLAYEEMGRPFNKAFLLHKNVRKESGTYEVDVILTHKELETCLYAV